MDRIKKVKRGRHETLLQHLPGYEADRNVRDPSVSVVLETKLTADSKSAF